MEDEKYYKGATHATLEASAILNKKKYNHIMIGILAEIFGSLLSELSLISIFNDT